MIPIARTRKLRPSPIKALAPYHRTGQRLGRGWKRILCWGNLSAVPETEVMPVVRGGKCPRLPADGDLRGTNTLGAWLVATAQASLLPSVEQVRVDGLLC